ncbi:MAG: hypothetical protein FJ122_17035 [Deltaproteobacteria bacterium]|nr:hypothetical protein [Deltaproteobacteria bacterium]
MTKTALDPRLVAKRFVSFDVLGIAEGWKGLVEDEILSHLQRGGAPSAHDRLMARWFGIAAVDMIINEEYGRMVSIRNGKISHVPFKGIVNGLKRVDVRNDYDTERYNGRRSIL